MEETDEEWLADYLRLEYGEDEADSGSIKAGDLVYAGEFLINDILTKYWKYPTTNGHSWVVIKEHTDCRSADISDEPPPN